MKKLRYVWKHRTSDEIKVHFPPVDASGKEVEHKPKYTAIFTPDGTLEDEYAERLLTNPKYAGWFETVDSTLPSEPAFECEICGKRVKTKAAMGAHARIHKKTQRGENETDS